MSRALWSAKARANRFILASPVARKHGNTRRRHVFTSLTARDRTRPQSPLISHALQRFPQPSNQAFTQHCLVTCLTRLAATGAPCRYHRAPTKRADSPHQPGQNRWRPFAQATNGAALPYRGLSSVSLEQIAHGAAQRERERERDLLGNRPCS